MKGGPHQGSQRPRALHVPRHWGTLLDVRFRGEVSGHPKPLASGDVRTDLYDRSLDAVDAISRAQGRMQLKKRLKAFDRYGSNLPSCMSDRLVPEEHHRCSVFVVLVPWVLRPWVRDRMPVNHGRVCFGCSSAAGLLSSCASSLKSQTSMTENLCTNGRQAPTPPRLRWGASLAGVSRWNSLPASGTFAVEQRCVPSNWPEHFLCLCDRRHCVVHGIMVSSDALLAYAMISHSNSQVAAIVREYCFSGKRSRKPAKFSASTYYFGISCSQRVKRPAKAAAGALNSQTQNNQRWQRPIVCLEHVEDTPFKIGVRFLLALLKRSSTVAVVSSTEDALLTSKHDPRLRCLKDET